MNEDEIKYCKSCGHSKDEHLVGMTDTHMFEEWDECTHTIVIGGVEYVCTCDKFYEVKGENQK